MNHRRMISAYAVGHTDVKSVFHFVLPKIDGFSMALDPIPGDSHIAIILFSPLI